MATKKADASTKTEDNLLISKVAEWPGAFGAFKYSSRAVIVNLSAILLLVLATFLASILQNAFNDGSMLSMLWGIVLNVLGFIIGIAIYIAYLQGAKGNKIEMGDAFKQALSLPLIINMFILSIMVVLSVVAGFIALIIPALFILPRLTLAPYFLIDQKLDCVEAYSASWKTTKGHSGKIWGTIGASIVMFLPVFTLIGIPLAIYLVFMYAAVGAVLYEYIKKTGPIKQ